MRLFVFAAASAIALSSCQSSQERMRAEFNEDAKFCSSIGNKGREVTDCAQRMQARRQEARRDRSAAFMTAGAQLMNAGQPKTVQCIQMAPTIVNCRSW